MVTVNASEKTNPLGQAALRAGCLNPKAPSISLSPALFHGFRTCSEFLCVPDTRLGAGAEANGQCAACGPSLQERQ